MDKYCRTCMRDSIKFSPIFEEMTYGGISLQEAIEDVCQLEISIGDGLPSYVCKDCALNLYDIVKFKMEANEVYCTLRKLMAIHPQIKVEIDESIEESSLLSPKTENIKVEEFCGSHSNEDEMPRYILEDSDGAEEIVERIHNKENLENQLKFENKERNLRCVSHKQVNIDPGDMENKYAGIYGDTPELRSILAVESGTMKVAESMENGNFREEIFQKNTKRTAEGKVNLCSQTLHLNGKEFDCDEIQIEDRKRDSKDVTSICFYHRVLLLEENGEEKGNPTNREKNCHSDGTHLQPERIGENESIESGSVDGHSILKDRVGVHEDATSNLTETTAASVGLGTSVSTGVDSYVCHICDKRFCKKSDLKKHERIHLVEKQLECEVGSRKFRMEYTFKRHQETHELCKESLRSDNRNDIKASFSSEILKQGSRKELDKIPINVADTECKNINKNSTLLIDSNVPLTEEGNGDCPKSLICDRCRKEFRNKKDLLEHFIRHCGRRTSSECLLPVVRKKEKKVRGWNAFNRNMEEKGLLRRKSNGKKLVVASELKIPETSGENKAAEKPFACQYCTKMFGTKRHRNQHETIHSGEKPFACKYCAKMFRLKFVRNRHELTHTGEKPFACKYCSKMFRSSSTRNNHHLIHTGEKPFACNYCSKMFNSKSSRNQHETIHSEEKPFACKYCAKMFRQKFVRNRHELTHTGEKPFACKYCSKMFRSSSTRNNHHLIHTGEKPFACNYCSKMFNSKSSRNLHEKIHSGEKPFECKYCSKMFSQKCNRNQHELTHTGEKPFACKYCAKMFSQKSSLTKHERIHTGQKPFACKYCSKMFMSSSNRNSHQLIHTGEKPFACKYCSKTFISKSTRNQHEIIHSGEKPFGCKYCSKMFSQKHIRIQHELTHTGEKPFACKYCAKMFSQKSSLMTHERIHTGQKPFACKYCSRMFRLNSCRKQHERTHTGEKPFACKYCSKMFRTLSHQKNHERIHSGEKPFACKYCSKMFRTTTHRKNHERIHSGEKPL